MTTDQANIAGRSLATSRMDVSSNRPVLLAIFLVVLLIPINFTVATVLLNPLRILLLLVIIPLLLNYLRGAYGRFLWTDLLFLLYIFWMGITLYVNNPDRLVQQVGSSGLEFFGGYLIGRACVRNPDDFVRLIKWLCGIILVMLPFAILETQNGIPIILEQFRKIPGLKTYADIHHPPRLGLLRAQVLLPHPIHFGLFCSTAFALVLIGLKDEITKTTRYLLTSMIGLSVVLSVSSGAILAVVLQVILILWAWTFEKVKKRWLYLAILFVVIYVAVDLLSNRSPIHVMMSYLTFSAHTAYWRSLIFEWGMVNVWNNPIFGIGLNRWERVWFMTTSSVDNFWLLTAMRHGIPAFLFLVIGYLWFLFKIGRIDFAEDERLSRQRLAWMITFCSMTFTLATVHVWETLYCFVFFLFGAGSWFIVAQPSVDNESSSEPAERRRIHYTRFP